MGYDAWVCLVWGVSIPLESKATTKAIRKALLGAASADTRNCLSKIPGTPYHHIRCFEGDRLAGEYIALQCRSSSAGRRKVPYSSDA